MRLRSDQAGFSLTELIIVMVIMGILLAVVGLNFNQWTTKSQIERNIRELHADLNTARMNSIYQKKEHRLVINSAATGYVLKRYSSENENKTSGGTELFSKSAPYQYAKASGATIVDRKFDFDVRGFTSDLDTIKINRTGSGAAFDCVVVSATRTNLGQMTGGSCVQK